MHHLDYKVMESFQFTNDKITHTVKSVHVHCTPEKYMNTGIFINTISDTFIMRLPY